MAAYLNVIIAIIMQVKHTVNFTVHTDVNVIDAFNAFADSLARILLHLNVVKFPAKNKALDHELNVNDTANPRNHEQLLDISLVKSPMATQITKRLHISQMQR